MTNSVDPAGTAPPHRDDHLAARLDVAHAPPPARPSAPVSPDGRWWWDGARWVPATTPRRVATPGSILVHVALGLGLLGGYAAMMMLIGIADLAASDAVFGVTDALTAAAVGILPVVLGLVAFLRLPRGDGLRLEAVFAVVLGLLDSGVLLAAMFLLA